MRLKLRFPKCVLAKFGSGQLGHKNICILVCIFLILNIFIQYFNGWILIDWHKTKKWIWTHINFSTTKKSAIHKRAPYCYTLPQEDDTVFSLPQYKVLPNSIFFLETSCRHDAAINITARQACAFESAAKVHPNSEILVLFTSPITLTNPTLLVSELLKYKNIKLLHIDMERYFVDTPLEKFQMENKIAKSKWPEHHASDVLRTLTLWKYGGTYLDADFIILRPVNTMENFAGAESSELINSAILNINISGIGGRQIIDEMILEIRDDFRPNVWYYNGPGVISRVLSRACNESDFEKMSREKCKDFTVFPPPPASPFYRVPWNSWETYFNETLSQAAMDQLGQSYALHMWNYMSKDARVKVHSRMPYSVFASRFCPRVYSTVLDYF